MLSYSNGLFGFLGYVIVAFESKSTDPVHGQSFRWDH